MGKRMIVTAACGGFGKALAAELASRGIDLFLCDIDGGKLDELKSGIEKAYGVSVHTFSCDLTSQEMRKRFYSWLKTTGGTFHGLMNIVGAESEGKFAGKDYEPLKNILDLNIMSTVETTHEVLRMRDPEELFHVLTISSFAAFQPMPYKAVYAASKRFLVNFSLAVGEEMRDEGVFFSVFCPAGMRTNQFVKDRIESAGFFGRATAMETTDVARIAVNGLFKGKRLIIPGFFNKLIHVFTHLVPYKANLRFVKRKFEKSLLKRTGTLTPKD